MGILRERMTEEMKLRNFSPATQKSYLYAVTRLTKYYRRPPDQLDIAGSGLSPTAKRFSPTTLQLNTKRVYFSSFRTRLSVRLLSRTAQNNLTARVFVSIMFPYQLD